MRKEWSRRQIKIALAWLDDQWNRPSRTDNYLMAIGCEIRRVLSKNPNRHQPRDLFLRFERHAPVAAPEVQYTTDGQACGPRPLTREQMARMRVAHMQWVAERAGKKQLPQPPQVPTRQHLTKQTGEDQQSE